jgi:hypothetical protein
VFEPGATDDAITRFIDRHLGTQRRDREGTDLLDGIRYVSGDYERRAVYVDYEDDASPARRRAVERAALAQPLVRQLFRDIEPARVPSPGKRTSTRAP